ncbi:MAG: aminotransferase class V-fold PLP-dependent enzyme [Gammaproteobacteria bacterium]|nr:aminotransferase class V-fold PLP-dependent enzyme [Gammaproteobacteria bacterium]
MTEPSSIYLDYAATTPVDPRVAEHMAACLTRDGCFANPGSSHAAGQAARAAVEQARAEVAALLGAAPAEIIWTSGATESDNLAIKGVADNDPGRHIVTAKTEHKAVLDSCAFLADNGCELSYLVPADNGVVTPSQVAGALREDTLLVSIMHVNNETGVINDIAAIGALCRERGVLFHVDAAQSAGKIPIDVAQMPVDLMSFSAHKLYGPKGMGALYVRDNVRLRLQAQIHGGGQESNLRSGTLATHQIVGIGEAFRLARLELDEEMQRLAGLRERLWNGLQRLGDVHINGHPEQRAPGFLNVRFGGVGGESLQFALRDLAVSSGSACLTTSAQGSYVLRALGLSDAEAMASIRFSLGRFTTTAEIDQAIERVSREVTRLRELAPDEGIPHAADGQS